MRALFYTFFLFTALVACNSNTIIKKPENLIPKDKMVDILLDTYIAKTARNIKNVNGERTVNYHALIYKEHGTDSLAFNKSLKYYTSDIKQHEEILKLVEAKLEYRITATEKKLQQEEEAHQKEMDEANKKDTIK
ncbi:DUF4296 domain-containing protein [Wenyingzhuangia aestuarii]|uniref:DUF4296 domain-containing protein n=1 Tax=Wenyingzhuangia aestuarii TaxID=1647582 RepID=UPI00143A5433|nr:DUF4296 domain-containing protein [Wenyingzhuangia aestuarii]NJB82320.1 hypothetical protein [Wenyingzhuangia aestuarii]